MEKENIHSGHRERLKKRFLNKGIESFEDHEILEMLLFYSISRRDTNPIAHSLCEKFGTLSKVFDANFDELMQVKGISEHSALLIKIIPQLCQRYTADKTLAKRMNLSTTRAMTEFSKTLFVGKNHEEFYVICMDSYSKLLTYKKISEGTLNATMLDLRQLAATVIHHNASRVFVTHNHPSGTSLPSSADIESTKRILNLLNSIGVVFDDHIIVSDKDTTSLASLGMLNTQL